MTYFPEENKESISGNQEEKKEYIREFILEGQEISSYFGNLDIFAKDLEKWQKEKQHIIILVRNEGRAQRLGVHSFPKSIIMLLDQDSGRC
ncbi:unnamed protein product [marine sediment metagenome]|uniref:Uncharacterized protein n=1 Tax=marine sediment metagenome TaxID=412755 RepID=X1DAD2_9ZZZZ